MEAEALWNRTKHTFDHMLTEGQKAAERLIHSLEGLTDAAKARVDKARLEWSLLRKSAELGTRVHQLARQPELASMPSLLEDEAVASLLAEIDKINAELSRTEREPTPKAA